MIEKMKKLTLLVSQRERDRFLSSLRKAGVVHIRQVKEPFSDELPAVEKHISEVDTALLAIDPYEGPGVTGKTAMEDDDLLGVAGEVAGAYHQKNQSHLDIQDLERKIAWYERWGEFDPDDVISLREKGVDIRLYRLSRKEYKQLKDKERVKEISRDGQNVYVVFVPAMPGEKLDHEEIGIPEKSPEGCRKEIADIEDRLKKIELLIEEKAAYKEEFLALKNTLLKKQEFLTVKFGMREEERFACLEGYCPLKYVEKVLCLARDSGFGYLVEEPDEPADTPTYITNPRWIDIVRPVFNFMKTVPGYNEFDISLVFLVFFSLFFAMLVGDAGYGILFLLITILVRRKARNLPPQPFFLMYLLSGATIAWGAVTGTWFGAQEIAKLPFISSLVVERMNSFIDGNQPFTMFLCFTIGAVHLTIAHLTKGFRAINSPRCLSQVGWISIVWGMFFAAGKLVIGRHFPHFALYLLGGGILLVLVFENFQKNVLKGMLGTLTQLPLSVIGAFSDVVSYIRLFAVGYATVVVAESFNSMAVGDGINSLIGGLIAALILFFGHALNIILALMAVIVHGIRLNMLEFSNHLGMQWSGKEYKPFTE